MHVLASAAALYERKRRNQGWNCARASAAAQTISSSLPPLAGQLCWLSAGGALGGVTRMPGGGVAASGAGVDGSASAPALPVSKKAQSIRATAALSAVFIATLCLEPMASTRERRDDRFVRISSLTDSRPELLTIVARWGLQRAGLHSQI